jgi:hypothetical protein
MYSRFLLLFLLLNSCSLGLNEEVSKPQVVVNPVKGGCLSGAGLVIDKYFKGEIEEKEIDGFWNCMENALVSFTTNTRGAKKDVWTGQELSKFLTTYFLKGKSIDPELVRDAMILKRGMLGGNDSEISKEEIEQTILFVRSLKSLSLKLRPHMPIKVENFLEKKYSTEQFESVLTEFQTGLKLVGASLEGKQGDYSFDQLNEFLGRLNLFLYEGDKEKGKWIASALNWTLALRPAKQIFISPPKEMIRAEDWSKIYELAPRYYSLYLRAKFYLETEETNFTYGSGLVQLDIFFQDFSFLMLALLKNHPKQEIHSSDVDELVDALHKNSLLPVEADTAKAFIRTLFGKIFMGPNADRGYVINRETLARVTYTFRFATDGLKLLEAHFRAQGLDIHSGTLDQNKIPTADELLNLVGSKELTTKNAAEYLVKSMKEVKTIFRAKENVVFIPEKRGDIRFSYSHLAKIHLFQSLNRLLLRSYGSNPNALEEHEIIALADDTFPMLQGLSLVSEETKKSVSKRLFEASLFLYSSDGLTSLNLTEAAELESLLVSTLVHGRYIHAKIAEQTNSLNTISPARSLIPSREYKERLFDLRKELWANIPGFLKFMETKNKKEQMKLIDNMFQFLRKGRESQDFTVSDTQSMVLLPYYIELLFSRFDLDENGLFDNSEAELAYPVFKPFLAKKAGEHGLTSDKDHHAVYMFLLAYQDLPTNMKATWLWRRHIMGDKTFSVDRAEVIQIFEKLLSK